MSKAAIIVLALLSVFHVPTLNAQTTLEYPINSPFELGQGWDTNLQRPVTATCIDFKKGKLASSDVPQSRLYVATDKSTTSLALSTSSSAELTLPIGSGSASLDFSGKISSAADSLLVIAEARVELGPEYVSPKDFTTPTIPAPQDSTSRTDRKSVV